MARVKGPLTKSGETKDRFELSLAKCLVRGVRGWLARHGTSIRWARLIARMVGHVHRAMCCAVVAVNSN